MDNKRDSNYHIISHIGQGAYGQVYKGRKKQTGQIVAIKTMKKKYFITYLEEKQKKISPTCDNKYKYSKSSNIKILYYCWILLKPVRNL